MLEPNVLTKTVVFTSFPRVVKYFLKMLIIF